MVWEFFLCEDIWFSMMLDNEKNPHTCHILWGSMLKFGNDMLINSGLYFIPIFSTLSVLFTLLAITPNSNEIPFPFNQ